MDATNTTTMEETDESSTAAAACLNDLVETLSQPERNLLSWLHDSPANHQLVSTEKESIVNRSVLLKTCQTLFQEIEHLGQLYRSLGETSKDDEHDTTTKTLSGLSQLYVDSSPSAALDAETVWGQVELQNDALVALLKKSIKRLTKSRADICVLEMAGVLSSDDEHDDEDNNNVGASDDDEAEDEGEEALPSHDGSGDDDEEEEDDETRRIRERMERAEQEMDDSEEENEEDDNIDDRKNSKKRSTEVAQERVAEESSLVDPAAEELNDGFFDINEMEDFADEEENFLPDDAFGQPEKKKKKTPEKLKSFHQRQREADLESRLDGDDEDDDDDDDDDEFEEEEQPLRRKNYRDDEDIDALYTLYQDAGSDEDTDDDDIVNMTAADFFGKPNKKYFQKHSSQMKGKNSNPKSNKGNDSWGEDGGELEEDRHVGWADQMDDDADDHNNGDDDNDDDQEGSSAVTRKHDNLDKSSHAKKADKLQRQTEQLEKEMLAEKPWQMTGETKSTTRPLNSLLEGTPEFNVASKTAPTITIESTASLEEVIKQRILSEEWDDIVPRELPDVGWHKNRGELPEVSQEKSKLGLGELYEREYLKKAAGFDKDAAEKESAEDIVKNEMKQLFANLCSKLDALSNYHFAPRPVADEAEVRPVSTPAIAMEEVLPLHVSDARGVAPEEVYRTKRGRDGLLRSETELDQVRNTKPFHRVETYRKKSTFLVSLAHHTIYLHRSCSFSLACAHMVYLLAPLSSSCRRTASDNAIRKRQRVARHARKNWPTKSLFHVSNLVWV
jgi:U3 small nucleolar RNA-associated protein MPP10